MGGSGEGFWRDGRVAMSDDPDAQARRRAVARVLALGGMAAVAGATAVPSRLLAARSAWPSTGNIELVVPSGPASGLDTAMRTVKRISDAKRLFNVPTIVVNRPGAGGTLAYQYLNQRPGDGRLLALASPSLVTNRLMGTGELDHRDVTPVCTLFSENIVFMVRMDSNLLDGRALVGALRKRPDAVSFGVATALGGANHIAAASVLKAVGLDARAGLYVPYKSGGDALVALLGGEVGVVPVAAPVAVPQAQAGKVRVLATASGQRLGGDLAGVPTWRELGVDMAYTSWRAIVAPRSTSEADVRAAAAAFASLAASPEWRSELDRQLWIGEYGGPEYTRRFLQEEYDEHRALLAQLGLVR